MSYLGLETVKPTKPMKRGDLYSFPVTTVDQIITDEDTNERLPEYLDKNFGMDLLWTNASPTSAFASQSVSVNISSYNYIAILFGDAYDRNTQLQFMAKGTAFIGASGLRCRTITMTDSTITFSDAAVQGGTNNVAVMPLKIFGVKGI